MSEVSELHHPFICDFLKPRKLLYVHADPSRKSTIAPGWPDFSVAVPHSGNRFVLIEFKTKTGRLSADQRRCHAALNLAGIAVHVRTDIASAQKDVLEAIAGLPPSPESLPRESALSMYIVNTPRFGDCLFDHRGQMMRRATFDDIKNYPRK